MRGVLPFLKDVWRLALPYFRSEERWPARGLLAAIVAMNLSLVGMNVVLSYWGRAFFNSLQNKDWNSFISLLFTWRPGTEGGIDGFMPGFSGIAVVYIVVAVYSTYLNQWLQIRWRRWMTENLLSQWLADGAYYRISLRANADDGASASAGTDNPDQRISEDLRSFVANTLSLGLDLLSNVVTLASFVAILWSLSGAFTVFGVAIPGYMVWVALIYAGFGTWATHLVGRPLILLNFRQQRVEADFRFALVRLRENMEGIALQNGEADEHRGLSARFEALASNWWAIMRRTKALNGLVAGYGQIASVFPYVVAAPGYFFGKLTLGDLTQTTGAFSRVQGAMSWFVTSYGDLASWRATVDRLTFFQGAIEAVRAAEPGLRVAPSSDGGWHVEGLGLSLPDGSPLLSDATVSLPPGRSVVISGRSGSGKSTLFRALAGIWPFGAGTVRRPAGKMLFLPQRPYIPLGTLRHALTYPDAAEVDDATVRDALAKAGLGRLQDRLYEDEPWTQRLSGGEQQRLALARALLARPDWLFLDEATASLDPGSEAEMYDILRRELPETTIVSIAHRPAVAGMHEDALVFRRGELGEAGSLAPAGA
jgi:putative ATP-binding cassette transporter